MLDSMVPDYKVGYKKSGALKLRLLETKLSRRAVLWNLGSKRQGIFMQNVTCFLTLFHRLTRFTEFALP